MVEKDTDITFPLSGVNVATEFGRVPKGTTAVGENVRAFDVLRRRARGGSRSGLTKFLEDMTPAGDFLIQHLNVIVDPQQPALLADDTVEDDGEEADPSSNNNAAGLGDRNPGRFVRSGGSARQPNRNGGNPPPPEGYRGTFLSIDVSDGHLDGSLLFSESGNGALNGLEVILFIVGDSGGWPPGDPPEGVQYWTVDSGTYDVLAALDGIGNTPRDGTIGLTADPIVTGGYAATVALD